MSRGHGQPIKSHVWLMLIPIKFFYLMFATKKTVRVNKLVLHMLQYRITVIQIKC